jgi:hypothetical protein
MKTLAPHDDGLNQNSSHDNSKLDLEVFQKALDKPLERGALEEKEGRYYFSVELMRCWIVKRYPIGTA